MIFKLKFELFFIHIDVSAYTNTTKAPQYYSKNIYYYICYFTDKKTGKKKRHGAFNFFRGETPA